MWELDFEMLLCADDLLVLGDEVQVGEEEAFADDSSVASSFSDLSDFDVARHNRFAREADFVERDDDWYANA